MLKTFDIKLDIEKDLYSPMQILFNVSNSDVESVQLNFEILQDENPFDLTGKTIQMAIQSPSRKVVYAGIEITEPIEGKASAILSQNAYLEEGIHISEVYITDIDQTIVTSPFHFNSWQSITAQETVPTDPTTGDVYWQNVLNKPLTFPPNTHSHPIAEVVGLQSALDGKANVGETGGGDGGGIALPITIADVTGLQPALDSKVDDAEMTGKADTIHTHAIADVTGLQPALDGKADDVHSHAIADVTGLQPALDGKADDIHSHAISDVTGLQTALDGKVDDAEMTGKADVGHTHAIADVTGLQPALDGKMDDGSAYLKTEAYSKTETYSKAETYNRTQIDAMAFPEGGGGATVVVEDNLLSTDPTNALSSNQGRILNETKADADHSHVIGDVTGLQTALDGKSDVNHNHDLTYAPIVHNHDGVYAPAEHSHTSANITDFGTAVAGAIPEDFLTITEGDALYQGKDTIPSHAHDEYLTQVEADALFLTPTEGDASYQPIGIVPAHTHDEYLTQPEGDALYQPLGTVPAHTHDEYLTLAEADASFLTPIEADALYLTNAEGDALYQPLGTTPSHAHDEYLTEAEADALFLTPAEANLSYQAIGTVPAHDHPEYLTEAEGDALFLTPTEGDARYQATGTVPAHSHTSANITDFGTAVAGAIPTEYVTQTEGDARYQAIGVVPAHTHTKANITDFAHTHTEADVTFGGTNAKTYVDTADNYILNTRMAGLTLWYGTQAEYDALTPSATTLYFITG
jgi:hypothetical protein